MIIDLIDFVQSLSDSAHEIIVCIDTNEEFIPRKSGTTKLVELTNLIDPLINKFGIEGEPPIYYLLPKKFDKYLNTILCDFLEIFDSCYIVAAVILFIFFVNIG